MAYIARDIKDRVAVGDDCYLLEATTNGRYKLIPSPDSVIESGTPINKALLQLMEDRIVWMLNRSFSDVTGNPFNISFNTLDGLTANGIWNPDLGRIEC